jgi:hypothetical protein
MGLRRRRVQLPRQIGGYSAAWSPSNGGRRRWRSRASPSPSRPDRSGTSAGSCGWRTAPPRPPARPAVPPSTRTTRSAARPRPQLPHERGDLSTGRGRRVNPAVLACLQVLTRSARRGHAPGGAGQRSPSYPVTQRPLVDPRVPGHLRDQLAGLPDQPHRALLEVPVELPARLSMDTQAMNSPVPLARVCRRGRIDLPASARLSSASGQAFISTRPGFHQHLARLSSGPGQAFISLWPGFPSVLEQASISP